MIVLCLVDTFIVSLHYQVCLFFTYLTSLPKYGHDSAHNNYFLCLQLCFYVYLCLQLQLIFYANPCPAVCTTELYALIGYCMVVRAGNKHKSTTLNLSIIFSDKMLISQDMMSFQAKGCESQHTKIIGRYQPVRPLSH